MPEVEQHAKTGSGIDPATGEWTPAFNGQRPPFPSGEPGPAVTHGAYSSPLVLGDRAQEITKLVRPHLPVPGAAFEGMLQQYAITLVRIERASEALDTTEAMLAAKGVSHASTYAAKRGDEIMSRLRADLRSWMRLSLSLAAELGLTPSAQGRLLRDTGIGRAAHAQAAMDALNDHIRRNYGDSREVAA